MIPACRAMNVNRDASIDWVGDNSETVLRRDAAGDPRGDRQVPGHVLVTLLPVKLRIFVEPQQGATYDQQLAVARLAEELGFDAFFRSDHYLRMGDGRRSARARPTRGSPSPAWPATPSTIRLGTLVTSATFRLPGPLAISVAEVDEMSGGRVELGLGAGWFEEEHDAYGIPFPPLGERFERLEEQLADHHRPVAAPRSATRSRSTAGTTRCRARRRCPSRCSARPADHRRRRRQCAPRALAATFADEFNLSFPRRQNIAPMFDLVRAACEKRDHDPDTLIRSAAQVAVVGEDEATFEKRAAAIGREPDELRHNGVAGTVEQAAEKLATLAAQGVERAYLQVLDLGDLDHLHTLAQLIER